MTSTVSVAMTEPALQLRKGKERMINDKIVVDLVQEREHFSSAVELHREHITLAMTSLLIDNFQVQWKQ